MRAVRRTEQGIELVDVPAPSGDGVRVRVGSIGICQTDLNLSKMGPLPFTMGHEFAGTLADGTPVGVQPTTPCGVCEECRAGNDAWCALGYQGLVGIGRDGGMADEVIVPEQSIVRLPSGLDAANGANLIEPLAIHLHTLDLVRFTPGMRTLVVGANVSGFGLLAVAAARARGAQTLDLDADRAFQQEAGARLGAGIKPSGTYDLVIEADGSEDAIHRAAEWCRPGGTLALVAGYYAPKTWNFTTAFVKELAVRFVAFYGTSPVHEGENVHGHGRSHGHGHAQSPRDVDAAAALLAREPEIGQVLNTHRFPLDAAAEAFAFAASDSESLKVVLEP